MRVVLSLSVIYADDDLIQLRVGAWNGAFGGTATAFAEVLQGFPKNERDMRRFEIGELEPNPASRSAAFRFYCLDRHGHVAVEVRVRSATRSTGMDDDATLPIDLDPASIDSFVNQLRGMSAAVGERVEIETAA